MKILSGVLNFPHKDIVFEFAKEYPDFISSVMTDELHLSLTICKQIHSYFVDNFPDCVGICVEIMSTFAALLKAKEKNVPLQKK